MTNPGQAGLPDLGMVNPGQAGLPDLGMINPGQAGILVGGTNHCKL
jgi:hypothetical protein